MSQRDLELLRFPTAYPIKVICRRAAQLRADIDDIVRRHTPELQDTEIHERDSNAGKFVSITYSIVARDAGHIMALVAELRTHAAVIMVI